MTGAAQGFSLALVLLALLAAPLLAPAGAMFLARTPRGIQCWSFAALVLAIGLPALGIALDLGFWRYEANIVALTLAYLSFGVIACSLFRLRPRVLGGSLGVVAVLPLVIGVIVAAIGGLGLAFIVADTVPRYVDSPTPEVKCYVRSFGHFMLSEAGLVVVLKEKLGLMPLIEREIMRERFVDPAFSATEACGMIIHAG